MKLRALVFDLDGTLIDGYDAIESALAHAMRALGREPPGRAEVREMVGHGLEKLLEEAVGTALADDGVRLFREYYPSVAAEKSRLLPGVEHVLHSLQDSGRVLSVASNKPPRFSRLILEAKGVAGVFRAIVGPDPRHPPKPDPSMLFEAMEVMGSRPEETVCVGDMEVDVEFARAAGVRSIVVPTGSRSRAFLETAGADLLIDDLSGLPAALAAMSPPSL
ncbi:MAG: HAD family hydrolase [Thermoanaerobaculia bacterium]